MPEQIFHPYRFAVDAITTEVTGVQIDGETVPVEDVWDANQAVVILAGREIRSSFRISVRLSDPNSSLREVVPHTEDVEASIPILVRAIVPDARVRKGVRATPTGTGFWEAETTLSASETVGVLNMTPLAIRGNDSSPVEGYAFRAGEGIAAGQGLKIYFQDRPVMPGGALDNEWKDFGSPDSGPMLNQNTDLAWYLDLTNQDHPKLLMNEGIEGLKKALDAPGLISRAARVRDALAHSMVQPVLTTLAIEALMGWPTENEEPDCKWHKDVLSTIAARDQNATTEVVIERWRTLWHEGKRAQLYAECQAAIQRHLNMPKAATYLVKSMESAND